MQIISTKMNNRNPKEKRGIFKTRSSEESWLREEDQIYYSVRISKMKTNEYSDPELARVQSYLLFTEMESRLFRWSRSFNHLKEQTRCGQLLVKPSSDAKNVADTKCHIRFQINRFSKIKSIWIESLLCAARVMPSFIDAAIRYSNR